MLLGLLEGCWFFIGEVAKGKKDRISHSVYIRRLELLCVQLYPLTEIRGLYGQHALRSEDFADCRPSCRLFILRDSKGTAGNMKKMIMTRNQVRQYPTSIRILLTWIAKYIILFTMPMKIEASLYSKFLRHLLDLLLYLIYLSMKYFWWLFPTSVQIYTSYITSEITIDDPVNIDHRVYQKHTIFKKIVYLRRWFHQSLHNTQHHIGRPYFSRMLPS